MDSVDRFRFESDLVDAVVRNALPERQDRTVSTLVLVGADDVVVSVPIASVMAEAATLMNPNGMLVFFAGVPNGTLASLDFSPVYLHNAQFTGTSGLTMDDQAQVMYSALDGSLSPARLVAAIGGGRVPEVRDALGIVRRALRRIVQGQLLR